MNASLPRHIGAIIGSVVTAVVVFLVSFIIGSNIAAVPGSWDTGTVVVFMIPIYLIVALAVGAAAFFAIRDGEQWRLLGFQERPFTAQNWVGPLALAATMSVGIYLTLYYPVNALADNSSRGALYLPAVASAPFLILLPAFVGITVFRWTWVAMSGQQAGDHLKYGLLGAAAGLLTHYPALFLFASIATRISEANHYASNVDAFMSGFLCWPLVAGPGFVLGLLGGHFGLKLAGHPIQTRPTTAETATWLPAILGAMAAGALSPLLFLVPMTVAILESWRL